jgi:hypothetical protein
MNKCAISDAVQALIESYDYIENDVPLNDTQITCVAHIVMLLINSYGPEYFTDPEIELINMMADHCTQFSQGNNDDYTH